MIAETGGGRPLGGLRLDAMLACLIGELGAQGWWPANSRFEMMAGAILVQNTNWRNAERSIANLAGMGLLDPQRLAGCDPVTLIAAIRPSGFMTAKARACRALAQWFVGNGAGDPGALGQVALGRMPDEQLRRSLLACPGVGPETADVIMLYAFGRRVFVTDAYARRLLRAMGFAIGGSYEVARAQAAPALARCALSASDLGELHGLIVTAGKKLRPGAGCDALLARLTAAV